MMEGRPFTQGTRKESETDQWKSAVSDHAIDWQSPKIVDKATDWGKRGIREAITIRKLLNNMKRVKGRYFLLHLYDDLLLVPRS